MGKGSSPPKSPDPFETASAEAQFNRVDTYGPSGGGVRYGFTNKKGDFVQGVAPEGRQSAQMMLESPYEEKIRTSLEPAALGLVNRVVTDNIDNMPNAARVKSFDDMADELFAAGYHRMAPQFEQENSRMLANMQARGIPIGSEAFGDAYRQQQQSVNDALIGLSSQATQMAGAEQSRQFGLDAAERSNAIGELATAMSGQYNPPASVPNGQVSNVDYGGMVSEKYQNDLSAWQYKQQQQMNTMNAIGSLGGAMLTKSDRRSKTDIIHIGYRGDLAVYAFRYIEDTPGPMQIGYMAQEVMHTHPEAVGTIGPWLAVDYSQLPALEVSHA